MNRFRKLVLTVGALAALAVGGAAFAQAQNAGSVATSQVQTQSVETGTPGDPADAPRAADTSEADQAEGGEQESGAGQESGTEKADSAGEKESPDGPDGQQGADDRGGESD